MRILYFSIAILFSFICSSASGLTSDLVRIEFFYEEGCLECAGIEKNIFPKLTERFGEQVVLEHYDINVVSNYMRLFHYQQKFSNQANESVSLVVDGSRFLNGTDAISTGLLHAVELSLNDKGRGAHAFDDVSEGYKSALLDSLSARADEFSLPMVIMLGLFDGFNPCAFSTLIFLISLLSASRKKRRDIALLATSFCLAAFITYTLIGLGVLHSLNFFNRFSSFKSVLEFGMGLLLVAFAGISFADAIRFHRTGRSSSVKMKLPSRLITLSRRALRHGVAAPHLLIGGFTTGVAVTALESVCTGQLYIPTLAVVIRSGEAGMREYLLLLAYNAAFIVPLICIFAIFLAGMRSTTLISWGKTQVVISKVILGSVFLILAIIAFCLAITAIK